MSYEFELVEGYEFQINILYKLLKDRIHNISHVKVPSYDIHRSFVNSNPYLKWYLVKKEACYLGSLYIKDDNSIGLNLKNADKTTVLSCVDFVRKNFIPRESSASFVPNYFYINVAATNFELIKVMGELFLTKLQISYKI